MNEDAYTLVSPCQLDVATFQQPAFDTRQNESIAAPGKTSILAAC